MKIRIKKFMSVFVAISIMFFSVIPMTCVQAASSKYIDCFEEATDIPDEIYVADNVGEYSLLTETYNNYIYFSKNATTPKAASLERVFDEPFSASEGYVVEFLAKFSIAKSKTLKFYNENEDVFLVLEFGKASGNEFQGSDIQLSNNTDDEFHKYKIVVISQDVAEIHYDDEKISGEFLINGSADLKSVRFTVAGGRGDNDLSLDNLAFYGLNDPLVCPPKIVLEQERNKVKLMADDGCSIYYTLDGSFPTESSTLYSKEIDVVDGMVIRAVAYDLNGERSFGISGGPYMFWIKPELPIEPQLGEKMYIEDFETREEIADFSKRPNYIFDADYGLSSKRQLVNEGNNKYVVVSRVLSDIPTDGWLQHTFEKYGEQNYEGSYCFEFSAKQKTSQPKKLRFSSSAGDNYFFDFSFGGKDSGSIGSKTIELPNNLDGEWHHYKLKIYESGNVELFYDGKQVDGVFSIAIGKVLKKYRFSLGGTATEGEPNEVAIDNICISDLEEQFPSMPSFSEKSGEFEYNSEVSLTTDDDCSIYYTLDGSYPEFIPENKYRAPIVIDSANMYIKAVSVRENGQYSACAVGGAYTPINENGIVRLTDMPFEQSLASNLTNASVDLCSLEDDLEITLVLGLYSDDKLLGELSTQEYVLSKGLNEALKINIEANTLANIARLYIWNKNDGDFKPLTDCWELK